MITLNDEYLSEHVPMAVGELMKKIPSGKDIHISTSPAFQQKMERLIRKERHYHAAQIMKKIGKGAAIFLLAAAVSLFGLCMSSSAVREHIFTFIESFFEGYKEIEIEQQAHSSNVPRIKPTYIADGFELVTDSFQKEVIYRNAAGDEILYDQVKSGSMILNTEVESSETQMISGQPVRIDTTDQMVWVHWQCDYGYFEFLASKQYRNEVIAMAESVVKQFSEE